MHPFCIHCLFFNLRSFTKWVAKVFRLKGEEGTHTISKLPNESFTPLYSNPFCKGITHDTLVGQNPGPPKIIETLWFICYLQMSTATGSINILLMAEFVAPFSPNFETKSQTSQTRWFTTYQHKLHQPKKHGSFNPSNMTSWWLNHPFEKYARRIGSFPPIFGAKQKYTKLMRTN